MTNQALDASFDQLNEAADEQILSTLKDPALREHVRGFHYPLMVSNLAKPGADIQATLNFTRFIQVMTACAAVINRANELDAVKKETIYNKPHVEAERFNLPSSQPLSEAFDKLSPEKMHLLHMAIGLAGEAGEMLDAVVQHVLGLDLDRENIIEEAGDSFFYLQGIIGADSIRSSLRHIQLANKVKLLGKRYKEGYSDQAAQDRADKAPGQ